MLDASALEIGRNKRTWFENPLGRIVDSYLCFVSGAGVGNPVWAFTASGIRRVSKPFRNAWRLIMILHWTPLLGGPRGAASSTSRYSGYEAAFNVTDGEREHSGKRRVE
jgi:hypothetical protein